MKKITNKNLQRNLIEFSKQIIERCGPLRLSSEGCTCRNTMCEGGREKEGFIGVYDSATEFRQISQSMDNCPTSCDISVSLYRIYEYERVGGSQEQGTGTWVESNVMYSSEISNLNEKWLLNGVLDVNVLKVDFVVLNTTTYSGETIGGHSRRTKRHFNNIIKFLRHFGFRAPIKMATHYGYCALFAIEQFSYEGDEYDGFFADSEELTSAKRIFGILAKLFDNEDMMIGLCSDKDELVIFLPSAKGELREQNRGMEVKRSFILNVPNDWSRNAMQRSTLHNVAEFMEELF